MRGQWFAHGSKNWNGAGAAAQSRARAAIKGIKQAKQLVAEKMNQQAVEANQRLLRHKVRELIQKNAEKDRELNMMKELLKCLRHRISAMEDTADWMRSQMSSGEPR